jgi:ABC-type polysaccharide/polyol phosphate export permease
MVHRLGIPIKQLCLGNAITTWVELLCLYGFLMFISLLNVINITITDYLFIFPSAILLITLGIPYAAIISSYSTNRSDARFILPIIFRFLLFTIPIFDHFHNRFNLISSIIAFSPLNLPFNLLDSSRNITQNEILIYSFFVLLGYISGVFLERKTQKSLWKISKPEHITNNNTL